MLQLRENIEPFCAAHMMCRGECLALLFAAKIHTNFVCFHPQIGHVNCTVCDEYSRIRLTHTQLHHPFIVRFHLRRRNIGSVHKSTNRTRSLHTTTSWSQKFLRNFSCYFQFVALCMCIPRPFEIILDYSVILDLYEEPF